jgi:hypothetical protein
MRSISAAVALALAISGCLALGPDSVVDGWPIGAEFRCSVARCERYIEVAAAELARRDPGHAAIVAATLHDLGTTIGDDGQEETLVFSGGPPSVVVFRLADATIRAVGVKMLLNGPEIGTTDWGPELDWNPPPGR